MVLLYYLVKHFTNWQIFYYIIKCFINYCFIIQLYNHFCILIFEVGGVGMCFFLLLINFYLYSCIFHKVHLKKWKCTCWNYVDVTVFEHLFSNMVLTLLIYISMTTWTLHLRHNCCPNYVHCYTVFLQNVSYLKFMQCYQHCVRIDTLSV